MKFAQRVAWISVIAAVLLILMGRVTLGQTRLNASVLVRYPGMSWAGGGYPVTLDGVAVRRPVPECRLTATEQATLTCVPLWAVNAITDDGVDGVIVHLKGEGITSDVFKTINGGLIQMRVKQGKKYTITVEQPVGFRDLEGPVLEGATFRAGSKSKGLKTTDLLVLQLWPK